MGSFDRRMFLATLGSAGISACSGGAAPSALERPVPNAVRLTATPTPSPSKVYDHLAKGISYDFVTGNLYVAGGPVLAIVGLKAPKGTTYVYKVGDLEIDDARAVAAGPNPAFAGNAYVADVGHGMIYLFDHGPTVRFEINLFKKPVGLALDSIVRKLYVCNDDDADGTYGKAVIELPLDDPHNPKVLAKSQSPRAVAIDDTSKTLYVADYYRDSILTIDKHGTVGSLGSGFANATGVAQRSPYTFVTDSNGLYRMDPRGHKALILSAPDYTGVSVDPSNGDVYVSEGDNGVLKLTLKD
jgi:DNA-binding beta-propeller fold protein YncE